MPSIVVIITRDITSDTDQSNVAYRPDRLTALLIEVPLFQSVHTNYNNAVDYTVDTIQKRQIDDSKLRVHKKEHVTPIADSSHGKISH